MPDDRTVELCTARESSAVLRPEAAAKYLGLKKGTLAKRRLRGERPHYVKLGKKAVGYRIRELEAWLEESQRASTSEVGIVRPSDSRSISSNPQKEFDTNG